MIVQYLEVSVVNSNIQEVSESILSVLSEPKRALTKEQIKTAIESDPSPPLLSLLGSSDSSPSLLGILFILVPVGVAAFYSYRRFRK